MCDRPAQELTMEGMQPCSAGSREGFVRFTHGEGTPCHRSRALMSEESTLGYEA
jgi:hypothetical protein